MTDDAGGPAVVDTVVDTVLHVLARIAPEADFDAIDPAEPLREQLDLDSVDFLNFVIGLHERLGIDIPEADYGKLASIDGAVAYLTAARS